ncbi:RNA polymerase sigma factor [Sphingobacterium anhuiense]|uniref:RNA polymerase sigma factor n=1 Tax=Sphingobacterium anhuiense TaxID=493780 RepID=UPI003C2BBE1B
MHLEKSDEELWASFKKGNFEAFSSIYNHYSHDMIRYGLKIQADKQIVQDAIHDLFIEIWSAKKRLSHIKSIRFYLLKSLRYKLLAVSRKQQKDNFVEIEEISETLAEENFKELLEDQDIKISQIKSSLKQLSTRQQEVIYLYFYLAYSIQQIADFMEVNYQSAANLLQRALAALRKLIKLHILLFIVNLIRFF